MQGSIHFPVGDKKKITGNGAKESTMNNTTNQSKRSPIIYNRTITTKYTKYLATKLTKQL